MKDHNYIRDDGTKVPVSQMTNDEIAECLRGVQIEVSDPPGLKPENVVERLKIELLIRHLGLR